MLKMGMDEQKNILDINPYGSKNAFLESLWVMIWGVKYLLRRCSDP
jgi:hypothetical protein